MFAGESFDGRVVECHQTSIGVCDHSVGDGVRQGVGVRDDFRIDVDDDRPAGVIGRVVAQQPNRDGVCGRQSVVADQHVGFDDLPRSGGFGQRRADLW